MKLPNLTESLCLQDAAVAYGESGLPIFQLVSRSKTPATPHSFYDATSDPVAIRERWKRNPEYNIALVMGERSGLMVVDVDPERGGFESIARLVAGQRGLETWSVETGGGGFHFYFQYEHGLKSRKDFLPGLELKSDGTYVVAPPSIHPSGRRYTVLDNDDVVPCPPWLRDAIRVAPAGQRRAEPIPEIIPAGERDVTLTSLAGSLHHRGITCAVIERALQSINQDLCDPPLSEAQVTKIARSISKYPRGGRQSAHRQTVQLQVKGGHS